LLAAYFPMLLDGVGRDALSSPDVALLAPLEEPDGWLEPTDAQSALVPTLLDLVGPIFELPLEPSIARASAGGHLTAAPEADVPGVCVPPVELGMPDDGEPKAGAPEGLPVPELGVWVPSPDGLD
jgi:hypothetical protein